MTVWYVHREGGAITSLHQEPQEDYATEALDTATSPELQAWIDKHLPAARPNSEPGYRALIERRATRLEKAGDMLGAIQLRLTI